MSFGASVGGREPGPSYARRLFVARVAAANFGPGLSSQAHQPWEHAEMPLLVGCHEPNTWLSERAIPAAFRKSKTPGVYFHALVNGPGVERPELASAGYRGLSLPLRNPVNISAGSLHLEAIRPAP